MSRSDTVSATIGVCAFTFLAGCVTLETYGDQALPQSERAVVEGYWRYQLLYDEELHIVSVDGKRDSGRDSWPYAYSVSLPSGRHWIQIAILRNSGEIARCAFAWTFEARHHYKLQRLRHDQFLLAHPSTPRFAASLAMVVTAPATPVEHLSAPAVCGKGSICRQSSDCPSEYSCQMDGGFEVGTCVSPHR